MAKTKTVNFENFKSDYVSKNGADTATLAEKIQKIAALNLREDEELKIIKSEIMPKVREEISFSYSNSGRTKYEQRRYFFDKCFIDGWQTLAVESKDREKEILRQIASKVFVAKYRLKYPNLQFYKESLYVNLSFFEKRSDQVMELEKKLYIKIDKDIQVLSKILIEKIEILDAILFLKIKDVDEKIQIRSFGHTSFRNVDEYLIDSDCCFADFIDAEILFFETKTFQNMEFLYIQTSKGVLDFKMYKQEYYASGFASDNIIYNFLLLN